ncbi:MAG: hypothetical protein HY902_03280, partial [Deltaproteobacteria bacterium]|nr:hypothetical protein [Deltaproteobacteria bacterium]
QQYDLDAAADELTKDPLFRFRTWSRRLDLEYFWLLLSPVSFKDAVAVDAPNAMVLVNSSMGTGSVLGAAAAAGIHVLEDQKGTQTWWIVSHKRGGFSHAALEEPQWKDLFKSSLWAGILVLKMPP